MPENADYVKKKCDKLKEIADQVKTPDESITITKFPFGTDILYGGGIFITIYQNEIGLAWLDIQPWISAHTFLNKSYVEYLVSIRQREE